MDKFIYDIPTKVYFGENQLGHLGKELSQFGQKVLVTYGGGSIKKTGLYSQVMDELKKAGLEIYEFSGIEPNPRVASVNQGAEICRQEKIDVLLAVGGGSVLDCTKAIGAATYYDGDAWDLVIKKVPIENCLPVVTILTLSATGSEMDTNAVISNPETNDKIGMKHPVMLPKVSFLDPTLTYSVGQYQTACGAADILSHIMEVYFNMEQDLYMLDRTMEGLMKTVIKYAPIAMVEPENYEARANLMWASSWAINGFLKGGRTLGWSCHPLEHQLSAYYDITHGLGLAILTPRWLEYTLDESNVSKLYEFGINVFEIDKNLEPMIVAKKSIEMLSNFLFRTLGLQRTLTEIGIDETHFETMAKKICGKGTLVSYKSLNMKDVVQIYKMCL